jgi:6-phosphogluconolactonase/glucosamine-6-phosphate isomerase/deaminase
VFIDEKTHKVLIIIRGATKEVTAEVLEKFKKTKCTINILSKFVKRIWRARPNEFEKPQALNLESVP